MGTVKGKGKKEKKVQKRKRNDAVKSKESIILILTTNEMVSVNCFTYPQPRLLGVAMSRPG